MAIDIEMARKWAKDKYPFLIGNDDAIVALYKKQVLGEDIVPKVKASGFYRESNRLEAGQNAIMLASIVGKENFITTMICSVCHKKVCEHNAPKISLYSNFYMMVDRAGQFTAKFFTTDAKEYEKLDNSSIVLLYGFLDAKDKFGEPKFNIRSFEPVTPEQSIAFINAVDFVNLKGIGGRVKASEWNNYLNSYSEDTRKFLLEHLMLKVDGEDIYTVVA